MSGGGSGPRIEVQFTGDRLSLEQVVRHARRAEEAGLPGVWTAEAFRDSLVPLAAIACATSRVRLGTAITQWTRTLPNMELAAGDLVELSGGRFTLGLGSTSREWNENWHGIRYDRPLRRMREYVQALRLLWGASLERPVSFEGEVFQVHNYVRFNGPLATPPPIVLGATRTGMAELAGEIADGVAFNAVASDRYIADVLVPAVTRGADRGERSFSEVERGVLLITAVSADHDHAYRLARHQIAFYSGVVDYFEPVMRHHGFQERYAAIRERFHAGELADAVALVTDEMVAALTLAGTPAEVRASISRFAGVVDFVMLYSPSFLLEPSEIDANHAAMIDAFAHSSQAPAA